VQAEHEYPPRELAGWRLTGTADRVETRADGTHAIVDYKTGAVPKKADVEAGEAVQLLHYALLDEQATAVEYLALHKDRKSVSLESGLAALRRALERRLAQVLAALERGAAMPANGAAAVCEHCAYRGLCRKGEWVSEPAPTATAPGSRS
jgi:ATP-dependent helicase/nuclease subunit B